MLVAGLATLAVISWTFSGAVGGRSAGAAAGNDGRTAASGPRGWPTPSAGQSSGAGGVSALTSGGRSASGSAKRSAGGHAAGGSAAGGSARRSAGKRGGVAGRPGPAASGQINRCSRKFVVLTLFATQNGADPQAGPQFEVYLVSTEAQTCKFNVGARHLALVIKSGKTRIWNSADCPNGQGSLITELQRGVPTVVPIVWGRQRATPGCTGRPSSAPAGTYSATAIDDGLTSNTDTFRVR